MSTELPLPQLLHSSSDMNSRHVFLLLLAGGAPVICMAECPLNARTTSSSPVKWLLPCLANSRASIKIVYNNNIAAIPSVRVEQKVWV